jgi:OOP family OmpA-OmpF porin
VSCRGLPALVLAWLPLQLVAAEPAAAPGVMSDRQIEQALQRPKTRSLVVLPAAGQEAAPQRGTESTEPAAAVQLKIPFAFNSSELLPEADAQLRALQTALASEGLAHDRFLVAGHTDGVGSAPYNRALSLRRADTVKRFLVAHGVGAERLQTAGYGADRLLLPERPNDAANRRVEIRNLDAR